MEEYLSSYNMSTSVFVRKNFGAKTVKVRSLIMILIKLVRKLSN